MLRLLWFFMLFWFLGHLKLLRLLWSFRLLRHPSDSLASSSRSELYLVEKSEQPDTGPTVVESWRLILLETVVEEGLSSD